MAPAQTIFLVNPASANGSTGRRWPEIARQAAAAGLSGDTLFSERPGHLAELARDAALAGTQRLVVVGGDGAVNEVANGLAGLLHAPDVTVLARGTGCDFVRTFGIPRQLEEAARIGVAGDIRTIDLGRASYRAWDGSDGTAVFANVASAGMSGAIAKRANETTKALGGKASYLWAIFAVFSGWAPANVEVTVENDVLSVTGRIDFAKYEALQPVYTEYNVGHYARSFQLSSKIDQGKISADLNEGVMTLVLPKAKEAKPRKINVG